MEFEGLPSLDVFVSSWCEHDVYEFQRACLMSSMGMTPDEFDSFEMCAVIASVVQETRNHQQVVSSMCCEVEESCLDYFPNDPFTVHFFDELN